jgi:putative ABC transport system permease protein
MPTSAYIPLSYGDLVAAALLILVNGAISLTFRLGLERTLLIAATRTIVQLGLIGFVLKFIFTTNNPAVTALAALVMVTVAGYEVWARQTNPVRGPWSAGLGASTLLVVGLAATFYVTFAIIGSEPWYRPAVFVPILGMMLGNALTGVALTLETVTQTAKSERAAIEARLALGHTRYEAFEGVMTRSLTTAMMPIVNAMAVAGVVSLPGMMTGQILAGVDPVEAAKYQIMIMFAIAGSSALAVIAATLGAIWLLSDERSRLRLDRLTTQ